MRNIMRIQQELSAVLCCCLLSSKGVTLKGWQCSNKRMRDVGLDIMHTPLCRRSQHHPWHEDGWLL